MNRLLVEIYLPAALQCFDVWIPGDVQLFHVTDLAAEALEQAEGQLYSAGNAPMLCDYKSGEILNINLTAWELGLRNGSQLMLI